MENEVQATGSEPRGKVVASYAVKVVLRERAEPGETPVEALRVKELEAFIERDIRIWTSGEVNATAERTDR